ncbi:hypothetical protein Hanom_Chr06g00544871 [Helianthus anomalus]
MSFLIPVELLISSLNFVICLSVSEFHWWTNLDITLATSNTSTPTRTFSRPLSCFLEGFHRPLNHDSPTMVQQVY